MGRVYVSAALLILLVAVPMAKADLSGLVNSDYITLPVVWSEQPYYDDAIGGLSKAGGKVVEDDFQMNAGQTTNEIAAIRWWGYYTDGFNPPSSGSEPFVVTFHWNVPANTTDPYDGEKLSYSHPTGTVIGGTTYGVIAQYTQSASEDTYAEGDYTYYEYNLMLNVPFDWLTASQSGPIPCRVRRSSGWTSRTRGRTTGTGPPALTPPPIPPRSTQCWHRHYRTPMAGSRPGPRRQSFHTAPRWRLWFRTKPSR